MLFKSTAPALGQRSLSLCLLLLALVSNTKGAALNASHYQYYRVEEPQGTQADTAADLPLGILLLHDQDMVRGKTIIRAANLTAIRWAHAVNSQQLLDEALAGDIEFIEADIVLGKVNGEGDDMPVMAHPPANVSDLTLQGFLNQIKDFNDLHEGNEKGVKLDFKSIEVFEGSLDILDATIPSMSYPIWINADIISGPVDQNKSVPVDPDRFFAGCMRYKQAVLSIGWTTNWGADFREGEYTKDQCDAMVESLSLNNVLSTGQGITFPVRAGIAANSEEQLHKLVAAVNETNESTLTIWSSDGDYVDVAKLRKLIFGFGVERVYLDVPDELAARLDLGNVGNGAGTFNSLVSFSFISLCFYAFATWLQRG
ncbi:protein FAM151B isoform X1 [Drosophila guanche]|uniref:Blast:Protein FAM151B n=2 Tax=Drosophila guanche TaxID=7266 RepID=A0A3B0JCQ8_DROGU|nr:protein FAM151B isoform X1 [Drosophila guanche]XP_034126111.1 protein FAM151B isoform X1 [Drosophila guanche]SPP79845.1 blast:Protein FAM151B [Drosophila guanche]